MHIVDILFWVFLTTMAILLWIRTIPVKEKSNEWTSEVKVFPVIRVWRDDSIPAFGAWAAGSLSDHREGVILLNVGACLLGGLDEEGNRVEMTTEDSKWLLITTLMHEFGHACQEFFDLEFTEERIDKIVQEYEEGFRSGKFKAIPANDGNPPS